MVRVKLTHSRIAWNLFFLLHLVLLPFRIEVCADEPKVSDSEAIEFIPHMPVKSRYLHRFPEKACLDSSENQDTWQHLQSNTGFCSNDAYDEEELDDDGLCFGLACAYLQATLNQPDTRKLLSQSLELCSQNAETGWDFYGVHWTDLQQPIEQAKQQYEAWRHAYGLKDGKAALDAFSKTNHDAAKLIQTSTWVQGIHYSQNRQRCTYGIQTGDSSGKTSQESAIASTQGWPVVLTKASAIELLRELRRLPAPAHYLLTTASHVIALSIEKDKITLFDQNAPCYFKQSEIIDSDELAADLFHALYTRPGCRATVDDNSAHIQCGVSSKLTDNNDSIRQQMDSLKIAHSFVVMSIRQVFPSNTPVKKIENVDANLGTLLDDFTYLYPVPPGTTDSEGYTRLHLASRDSNIDSVKQLLDEGESPELLSSPSVFGQPGRTPLELARARKNQEVVRLLESYSTGSPDRFQSPRTDVLHLYQTHWPVNRQSVPVDTHQAHWENHSGS